MRKHLFYLLHFIWLSCAASLLYYFPLSEIFDWASHFTKQSHLLVIGLLPIYLGLLIFGTAMLLVRLRAALWPILSQYFKH